MAGLAMLLEQDLDTIRKHLPLFISDEDKLGLLEMLQSIRDLSLAMFHNLDRILVVPGVPGTITIEGYVPTSLLDEFKGLFGDDVIQGHLVKKYGKQDPYVPSLLVNRSVVSLFEQLSLMRGVPKYNEIDPTPIIALVFPFFFGIMFGDVGHGLALFSFGVYLLQKTKYLYWGKLIIVFGLAATLFGFLRGSFFGMEFQSPFQRLVQLPDAFSAHFTLFFIPLLLEIAIVIGTFHLAGAYLIGFLNELRSGHYAEAFLDRFPTLSLYSSLVEFGLAFVGNGLSLTNILSSAAPTSVFPDLLGLYLPVSVTATVSLAMIVGSLLLLITGRPLIVAASSRFKRMQKVLRSLVSSAIEAAARPVEFFMNTVSYVRLGVLLISTTLLGSQIAGFLAYGAIGVFLAVFSNIAVMSLEGVILYIQDMRLHLYEWLPKFYSGSGIPFVPLIKDASNFAFDFQPKQVVMNLQF